MNPYWSIPVGLLVFGAATVSCTDLRCGDGTVERDGECVPAAPVGGAECEPGSIVIGDTCFPPDGRLPLVCGPDTRYDPMIHRCVGTGGGAAGACANRCSTPTASSLCVTGTAVSFLHPTVAAEPTPTSRLLVRVYDPIAFVVDPTGTQPLAVAEVEQDGCYVAPDVPRPGSGLIALAIDDENPSVADSFVNAGVGATLQPGRNVTGLKVYYVASATIAEWESQVGYPGMLGQGIYIGQYLDHTGAPVSGAAPVLPDPTSTSIFCFRGNRATLSTATETDALGLCLASPDTVGTHSATCASSGCTCGGSSCSPQWTGTIAGTAPNVVFIDTRQAM